MYERDKLDLIVLIPLELVETIDAEEDLVSLFSFIDHSFERAQQAGQC